MPRAKVPPKRLERASRALSWLAAKVNDAVNMDRQNVMNLFDIILF